MEKFILKSAILVSLLSTIACAGGGSDDSVRTFGATGLDPYTIASGVFSTATATELTGSGSVVFKTALPLANDRRMIRLEGSLASNSSYVISEFFTNDPTLFSPNGLRVKISRDNILLTVGTKSYAGVSAAKTALFTAAPYSTVIVFDNALGASRIYIWRSSVPVYLANSADVDTNTATDIAGTYPSDSNGTGTNAGLTLFQATVTRAIVSSALF